MATKKLNVKNSVFTAADKVWTKAGKPKDVKQLLELRKRVMDSLEKKGFNRTSCSTLLGQWQSALLSE